MNNQNQALTRVQNAIKMYMNSEIKKYENAAKNAKNATNAAQTLPTEANASKAAKANANAAVAAESTNAAVKAANQAGVPLTPGQENKINKAMNNHANAIKNFAKMIANANNNAALNAIGANPNFIALPNNKKTNFLRQINAKRGLLAMPQV